MTLLNKLMLILSRTTRQEIMRQTIDLNALAHRIAKELGRRSRSKRLNASSRTRFSRTEMLRC